MHDHRAAPHRREVLRGIGAGAVAAALAGLRGASAAETISLPLASDPRLRLVTTGFPQKGRMVLQRTRPPLLETPFEVFDKEIFTPNEQFFVRWHWAVIPERIDAAAFRLVVRGQVNKALSLSLGDIAALPQVEIAAVNQCSGNSRGVFQPRVPGGQWGNGAMGNARWAGVRLKDVLDRAGVRPGAVQVRFNGLDEPVVAGAPDFTKSLAIDHARDGEVMIAYAMNGQQLPLLNGFPLRLVVPGWYSTYWVKMLSDIEVLAHADDSYWMTSAYKIPDTPNADVKPGETGYPTVTISRMNPRAFVTNMTPSQEVRAGAPVGIRGIAMGGDCGVARVDISIDGGRSWQPARLGADHGQYSLRRWDAGVSFSRRGPHTVMVRCTNRSGATQPLQRNWNPGGFMQNGVEVTPLRAV
jgi:DMSO/TMAO reductase YedYZ molybdopterin-dependent catalytic subunit